MPVYSSYKDKSNSGYSYTQQSNQTQSNRIDNMDDGGKSASIRDKILTNADIYNLDSDAYTSLLHSNQMFSRSEIDLFNKTYRFGLLNPYGAISNAREFLFFTKPDLNIYARDDETGILQGGPILNPSLQNYAYWRDLAKTKGRIIQALQLSADPKDNFNHLLQNQVISNLEIPGLTAESIDTPTNMYGVGFSYRGSSEASDDNPEFSLEFKDTKWLDVYYYFKSYEEYQTLKHHGTIRPWKKYIENKILHDQISIYKFLVGEDMESIIYYGKYYGVIPMTLPRDVFSSGTFDQGISYSINFKAAFFEDMKPEIIGDFNALSESYYNSLPYQIDVYNDVFNRVDNRPAKAAYIVKEESKYSPNKYVLKLKWRGSDNV